MDYARATAPLPEIAGHFASLYRSFWSLESLPPEALELCRLRIAQLLGSELAFEHEEVPLPADRRHALRDWPGSDLFSPGEKACLELAEMHAMDAAAITDEQADAVKAHHGEVGFVALVQALGVFDAVTRLGLIWDLATLEVAFDGG